MAEKIKKCQICNKVLNTNDDIVVCPICAAPHHRDCYNELNHCGVEQYHGTENQYDIVQKQINESTENFIKRKPCPYCKNLVDENSIICSHCGNSLSEQTPEPPFSHTIKNFNFTMPDGYGGVDKNAEINGVGVKNIKKFLGPNSQYYLPRFLNMFKSKISWNWAGFLFPFVWLFYRKLYKEGILTLLAFISSYVASAPLYSFINSVASTLSNDATQTQLINAIVENISLIKPTTVLLNTLGIFINIAIRIIIGLFGNCIYKNHCITEIKEIEKSSEDKNYLYSKKGLVNPILMVLSLILSSYLFQIVMLFF